ncbi:MAG: hypothetical protein ACJ8R9_10515 [Steroidobacteraceae bacterium]
MRVLVAGRNAKVLATAAGTFSHDLTIEAASTKAACIALLERVDFDLIVACETLGDGSGLEVLSHAAVNTPNALRIFAARPSTLEILKGELGLFGLFRTLPYPINFRKLWAAINLARSCCAEKEPGPQVQVRARTPGVRHVVLESDWQTGEPASEVRQQGTTPVQRPLARAQGTATSRQAQEPRRAAQARTAAATQRTANAATAPARNGAATQRTTNAATAPARNGAATQRTANTATAPARNGAATQRTANTATAPARNGAATQRTANAATAPARNGAATQRTANATAARARTGATAAANNSAARTPQARTNSTAQRTPNKAVAPAPARTTAAIQATARSIPTTPASASRRDARIPESDAFKRALAKRNAAKLDTNTHISAMEVLGVARAPGPHGNRGERRQEPAMSNDSLAQLARLATTRRPTYEPRSTAGGKKRAAIFVGSGVFAAVTAAVLTFFMLNANNSIGHTSLPLVAAVERPTPQKLFAWEASPQQPASPLPIRNETPAATAADLEVQAEADSDASAVEPGHPGPPPPNPPPAPSEPPSADTPGWVDE